MNIKNDHDSVLTAIETAVAASASKITYGGGAVTAFLGWLGSNEFAIFSGVAVGLATLWLNWHFNRRRDRRESKRAAEETEAHDERMRRSLLTHRTEETP